MTGQEMNNMEYRGADQGFELEAPKEFSSGIDRVPRIKKGYFAASLVSVNPRQTKDGKIVEISLPDGTKKRQLVLNFAIHNIVDGKTPEDKSTVGTPVTYKTGETQNIEKDLVLASVLNYEYIGTDGNVRSALTPKSRLTAVLAALGWVLEPGKKLRFGDLVGRWVEVNIDDADKKFKEANGTESTYKASQIKDINPWTGEIPDVPKREEQPQKEVNHYGFKDKKQVENKISIMRELKADGNITEQAFNDAMEQLKKALESFGG